MLRDGGELDVQGFSFADFGERKSPAIVSVEQGADGATATIPDAHLLFNSEFTRAGNDLHLNGTDGERAIVRDYFTTSERPALMSGEGARLSPDLVDALTQSVSPRHYAQAAPAAPAAADAVGRVVTASADSTVLRNGAPVTVRPGDPILRADVLQTAGGTLAVTFNDGSTLNLTANTRIVVSEFVYSPNGTGNSQLLDLVQGSLTFISGEVAHSGNMSIGTPVATMGIRGTVGGVTTASNGTVQFYVSQSATGAVIINQQGQIIANVVQDGPLIVVRPVGPLEVVAEEIGKTPQQLAIELQALQQIVSIKAIGDQILQQFLQPQQQGPNPQSPQNGPHTQIQADDKIKISLFYDGDKVGGDGHTLFDHAVLQPTTGTPEVPAPAITVVLPPNLPPVTFAPLKIAATEDVSWTFNGPSAISIVDTDSQTLTVTLSVAHGVITLASTAGLAFGAGGGNAASSITFSGTPAAIKAALDGLQYTPSQDFNGSDVLTITKTDGNSAPTSTAVDIAVAAVNDAPILNFFNVNVNEGGTVVLSANNYSVTDPDGDLLVFTVTNVTGGYFVVDSGQSNSAMAFSFVNDSGPAQNAQGITFTAGDIAAGRVKFVHDGGENPPAFTIVVSDGTVSSNAIEGFGVVTSHVDDPPDVTVSGTLSVDEDTALVFGGAGAPAITISDSDTDILTVTLTVSHGTLNLDLSSEPDIDIIVGGQGEATITFTASQSVIDNVLNGLKYEPDPDYNGADALQIAVNDGKATTSQTVAITINPVNDAPCVTGSEATVSEADLGGCMPETASGSIVATDADGDTLTYTLGEPTAALTSGGEFISWSGAGTCTLIGYVCETPIITIRLDSVTGAYTVTLQGPVDHPQGCEGDALTFDVPVVVSDGRASTDTSIAVTVEDDAPRAVDYNTTAVATAATTVNLVIMLDLSGSMAGSDRIGLAKDALHNLLTTTDVVVNQVMVVGFENGVSEQHILSWTNASAADSFIGDLQANGIATNYGAALEAVEANWGAGPSEADRTLVYFITDGQPNAGSVDEQAWTTFLAAHDVDFSHAIGIDTVVDNAALAPITWAAPNNPDLLPHILESASDLDSTLQDLVDYAPPLHNVFTDGEAGASYGADGGRIASIAYDDVTWTWDGETIAYHQGSSSGAWVGSYVDESLRGGGRFQFYFADDDGHAAGDWVYTPPALLTGPPTYDFKYTLIDGDGDEATGTVSVAVTAPSISWLTPSSGNNVAFEIANPTGQYTVSWGSPAGSSQGTSFSHAYADGTSSLLTIDPPGNNDLTVYSVRIGGTELFPNLVSGGGGNDIMAGEANSVIGLTFDSSRGNDVMFATGGADTFVFATGYGHDTVVGFNAASDMIDIAGLGIDANDSAALEAFIDGGVDSGHGLVFTAGADSLFLQDVHEVTAQNFIHLV